MKNQSTISCETCTTEHRKLLFISRMGRWPVVRGDNHKLQSHCSKEI